MPVKLKFVETIEEIRESLHTFNAEVGAQPKVARSLLTQTSYWVWDPSSKKFGPSKFVGLQHMNVSDYEAARKGDYLGAPFDGHPTQQKIASLIGEAYKHDDALAKQLDKWGRLLIPDDPATGSTIFEGVDRGKWKFIALPKPHGGPGDWTNDEVHHIIHDYFSMLAIELSGGQYSKAAHRAKLLKKLNGRSAGAVEFKHCNISAVLDQSGLPYINGYKPRGNYQTQLEVAVQKFLIDHPEVLQRIEAKLSEPPKQALDASKFRIEDIEEPAPTLSSKESAAGGAVKKNNGAFVDWGKMGAEQTRLGKLGEEFVLGLEKQHLMEAGRADLAAKVKWISKDDGDGLGYDVLSYQDDGTPKHIEVKTTNGGKTAPFILTANELSVAESLSESFWLYRVFKYSSGKPGLYRLKGPLSKKLSLVPIEYRARPKG